MSLPYQTAPGHSQVSAATRVLLNDLNVLDRNYAKELLDIYGNENYMVILEALGNTYQEVNADGRDFYHYEQGGAVMEAVKVNANVTGISAGANITVTLHSSSHRDSGTDSPIRVGETVRIMSSGFEAKIISVNKATAGAHTATLKPVRTTDALVSAGQTTVLSASDYLLFRGATEMGEGSDAVGSLAPLVNKITNTTTEIRDDFKVTDRADLEKTEYSVDGQQYYTYHGLRNMNKRFLNSIFFKIMEGVAVDNVTGSVGTKGVIPQVSALGSTLSYTAGSLAMSKFQELTRALDFFGGAGEYHGVLDTYLRQEVDSLFFGTYNNGAINYGSVGASQEAAVSYGFSSIHIDGYTFHLFKNKAFNPESVYKINPGSIVPEKKNFGIFLPQRINSDAKSGAQFPSFQVVYQPVQGQKIYTYETGGFSKGGNKTTKLEKNITMAAYAGARVFAANQFAILEG